MGSPWLYERPRWPATTRTRMSRDETNEGRSPDWRDCWALALTRITLWPNTVDPGSGVPGSVAAPSEETNVMLGVAASAGLAGARANEPASSARAIHAVHELRGIGHLYVARLGQLGLDHETRHGRELGMASGQS